MAKLAETVAKAGIDASSLQVFFETPEETAFELACPGAKALETWRTLRTHLADAGQWPVIVGTSEDVAAFREKVKKEPLPPTSELIEDVEELPPDPETLTEKRISARITKQREYPSGRWPPQMRPSTEFSVPFDETTGKPLPEVHIGIFPTPKFWQVPLMLRFGGWKDCPSSLEHAALMRHWQRRYGAELVAMTYEVVELAVSRPPTDRETALRLATQQYDYCSAIVDKGIGTVENLAGTLVGGTVWHFWWD